MNLTTLVKGKSSRFIAQPHGQHGDWSVYDTQRGIYWTRGCTKEEAETGAAQYNLKFNA